MSVDCFSQKRVKSPIIVCATVAEQLCFENFDLHPSRHSMYSLNLALLWCEHAWPTNVDDADMVQNRVFNNAKRKQVDIRARIVEKPRARKSEGFRQL